MRKELRRLYKKRCFFCETISGKKRQLRNRKAVQQTLRLSGTYRERQKPQQHLHGHAAAFSFMVLKNAAAGSMLGVVPRKLILSCTKNPVCKKRRFPAQVSVKEKTQIEDGHHFVETTALPLVATVGTGFL